MFTANAVGSQGSGSQGGGNPPVSISFEKTKILKLLTDGVYGLDNSSIRDAGDRAVTVTRFGDAVNTRFSPFSQSGWAAWFDGVGYMSFAHNNLFNPTTSSFTEEFTVQFSICPENWGANGCGIIGQKLNDTSTGWVIYNNTSAGATKLTARIGGSGSTYDIVSTSDVINGQWSHWALVIRDNVAYLYKDGVLDASKAVPATLEDSTGLLMVGHTQTWSGNAPFRGKMSNVRIVKGQSVITGNYVPSTEPLPLITGTVLSLFTENRLRDRSTNGFAATKTNVVAAVNVSTLEAQAYDSVINAGSMYFDGTGDYYKVAADAGCNSVTSGPFTVDFWFYPIKIGVQQALMQFCTGDNGYATFMPTISAANELRLYGSNNGGSNWALNNILLSSTVNFNEWNHLSFNSNSNGGITVFYNFKKVYENSAYNGASITSIGCLFGIYKALTNYTMPYNGYISCPRVEVGQVLYTADHAPVAEAPVPGPFTTLFIRGGDTNIHDATGHYSVRSLGNAKIDTAFKRNGKNTLIFDGSGDNINILPVKNVALSGAMNVIPAKGDFEIKFAVNVSNTNVACTFVSTRASATAASGTIAIHRTSANVLNFTYGITVAAIAAVLIKPRNWYTICLSRKGTMWYLYVNDSLAFSVSDTASYSSQYFSIGSENDGSNCLNGYISDFSATIGSTTYTDVIQVPAAVSDNKLSLTNPDFMSDIFSLGLDNSLYDKNYGNPVVDLVDSSYARTLQLNNIIDSAMSPFSRGAFCIDQCGSTGTSYVALPVGANIDYYGKITTIEAWVNIRYAGSSGDQKYILNNIDASGSANQVGFGVYAITGSDAFQLRLYSAKTATYVSTTIYGDMNEWVHVAVEIDARAPSTAIPVNFFINGVKEAKTHDFSTLVSGGALPTRELRVLESGATSDLSSVFALRVVQSATESVYPASFTPVKAKLTAIPGTVILMAQSPFLIEEGPNRYKLSVYNGYSTTITNDSDVSIIPWSPVPITEEQDFAIQGASLSFTTQDSTLGVPLIQGTKAWSTGTGDFTISSSVLWPDASAGTKTLIYLTTSDGKYVKLGFTPTAVVLYWLTSDRTTGMTHKFGMGMWYHFALVRKNGTVRFYINGKEFVNFPSTDNLDFTGYRIGQALSNLESINANVSHLHIANKALFDAEFIPDATDRIQVPESVVLYNFNRTPVIYDKTCNYTVIPRNKTAGGTVFSKINALQSDHPFDPNALEVNTVGQKSWIALSSTRWMKFDIHDFTIELMYKRTGTGYLDIISSDTANTFAYFNLYDNNGALSVGMSTDGTTWNLANNTVGTLAINTWYHIVVRRVSGVVSVYLNGSLNFKSTVTPNALIFSKIPVFNFGGRTGDMAGLISQVKIKLGKASYINNSVES